MTDRAKFSHLTRHFGAARRDAVERIKVQLRAELEAGQPAR